LGELLLDWMWAQRPPAPVALLAAHLGVDRSTVISWLTTDRQPQPLQLLVLAQVTELPLTELARAADVPLERIMRQRDALWDYIEWEIRRSHVTPRDDDCEAFLERLSAERVVASSVIRRQDDRAARSGEDDET
jgi:transcriptional regulator with XRE-family HTH domain